MKPNVEDVAAMREQGDLKGYLLGLIGEAPAVTQKPTLTAVPAPAYQITHVGGWPLGAAASGPLAPSADRCTCAKCGGNPASRATHQPQEGTAA